ncbi:MAG: hypothetical protein MH132_05540 [Hydrotalea sp.]|jgi:hypothetical protein|nr:hypothetical protein [Hydrotalea sp.]
MKKLIGLFVLTIAAYSLQAAPKENYLACGTASKTISSDCWTATYTVTVCDPTLDEVSAHVKALLLASQKTKSLVSLVQALNDLDPC